MWENSPLRAVNLEKVGDSLNGSLGRGYIYTYTYKSLSEREAQARARIALTRDHPDESPLNWKLMTP